MTNPKEVQDSPLDGPKGATPSGASKDLAPAEQSPVLADSGRAVVEGNTCYDGGTRWGIKVPYRFRLTVQTAIALVGSVVQQPDLKESARAAIDELPFRTKAEKCSLISLCTQLRQACSAVEQAAKQSLADDLGPDTAIRWGDQFFTTAPDSTLILSDPEGLLGWLGEEGPWEDWAYLLGRHLQKEPHAKAALRAIINREAALRSVLKVNASTVQISKVRALVIDRLKDKEITPEMRRDRAEAVANTFYHREYGSERKLQAKPVNHKDTTKIAKKLEDGQTATKSNGRWKPVTNELEGE